jgi:hypothetical protein
MEHVSRDFAKVLRHPDFAVVPSIASPCIALSSGKVKEKWLIVRLVGMWYQPASDTAKSIH